MSPAWGRGGRRQPGREKTAGAGPILSVCLVEWRGVQRLGRGNFLARLSLVIWSSITKPVYGQGQAGQVRVGEVDDVERSPDSAGLIVIVPCQVPVGDVGDVERSPDSAGVIVIVPCQVPVFRFLVFIFLIFLLPIFILVLLGTFTFGTGFLVLNSSKPRMQLFYGVSLFNFGYTFSRVSWGY